MDVQQYFRSHGKLCKLHPPPGQLHQVFLTSSKAHAGHHMLLTFGFVAGCDLEKSGGMIPQTSFLLKVWNFIVGFQTQIHV